MKKFGGLLLALVLLIAVPEAHAQKFGWVDSEFILTKMPDYAKAQQELNLISDTWQRRLRCNAKTLSSCTASIKPKKLF